MVLAFDLGHLESLRVQLYEYSKMCDEGEFNVNVIIATSTAAIWTKETLEDFKRRFFCERINGPIGIEIEQHPKALNIKVAEKHRLSIKRYINDYDLFLYQEDDIIITTQNVQAYETEMKELVLLMGKEAYTKWAPGFLRYRLNLSQDPRHGGNRFSSRPQDLASGTIPQLGARGQKEVTREIPVFESRKTYIEEMPLQEPLCLPLPSQLKQTAKDDSRPPVEPQPYFRLDGNVHQASFLLTKPQAHALEKYCNFTNHRMWNLGDQYGREYMSSFSLYWSFLFRQKTIPSCRLKKVLPAPLYQSLPRFSVLHFYHQKHFLMMTVREFAARVDEYERRIQYFQERGVQKQENEIRKCFVPEQEYVNYPQPVISEPLRGTTPTEGSDLDPSVSSSDMDSSEGVIGDENDRNDDGK